uniref:Uncharacterized protein n=1 Tax=Caenorhabditis japonica TaxID=281687 RepID=A0A8R1I3I9_CAEJA
MFQTFSHHLQLCKNDNSTRHSSPQVVLLREHKSEDVRMKDALSDVECWLRKRFVISEAFSIKSKGDDGVMCYKMATVPIQRGQLMVVVSEGSSAENCSISIYGPIPNILNIKMYIDGTSTDPTRQVELKLHNTGGHIAVQSPLRTPTHVAKITKTVDFLLEVSNKTGEYKKLLPFWKPAIEIPPSAYEIRKKKEEQLKNEQISISWVMILSVLPMLLFATVVSCFITIHPRGGLTYTDEEIDFTITEVNSDPKVSSNERKTRKTLFPAAVATELPTKTAMEPDVPTNTAISEEQLKTDKTVLSDKTSEQEQKAVKKSVRKDAKSVDSVNVKETVSLKTGIDSKSRSRSRSKSKSGSGSGSGSKKEVSREK